LAHGVDDHAYRLLYPQPVPPTTSAASSLAVQRRAPALVHVAAAPAWSCRPKHCPLDVVLPPHTPAAGQYFQLGQPSRSTVSHVAAEAAGGEAEEEDVHSFDMLPPVDTNPVGADWHTKPAMQHVVWSTFIPVASLKK